MTQKIVSKKSILQRSAFDMKFWIMACIVFLVSFVFYAGSLSNEYALDDGIVMEKNEYVHKGFGGIKEIMTKDAYSSFFKQMGSKGQLSGGRYRPLSIVTFAMEYQLFGFQPGDMVSATGTDGKAYTGKLKKIAPNGQVTYTTKEFGDGAAQITQLHEFKKLAHTQHYINVLLFAISMQVLFMFLQKVLFRRLDNNYYWSFFATLVFAMHPIHSEVVANIKSRDEIMSLLFILLTLLQVDKQMQKSSILHQMVIGVFFFLAMLSKEYGAVLLVIVPAWIYIQQKKFDPLKILAITFPLILAMLPYAFLRINSVMVANLSDVKPDVLNNYYLFAKGDEARATQFYILLKYLMLQIFPYPLSSDYSFRSIPFRHFSSPEVILSIVIHLGVLIGIVFSVIKRNAIVLFALLFYLLNLLLVSNLIFNIGASMGERLVYHSSLGLVILFFYGLYVLTKKIKAKKSYLFVGGGVTTILALPFFVITMQRCFAWKNDYTLATADVQTNPNSALLNANAGTYLFNRSELFENKDRSLDMTFKAKKYFQKALEVHPTMANSWMNLSLIEYKLKNYDSATVCINKAFEIFPSNPQVTTIQNLISNDLVNIGFEKYKQGKVDSCFIYLYQAKAVGINNPEVYYNLGGAYLSVAKNADSAVFYFNKTLSMNPNHAGALQGLGSIKGTQQ